MAVPLRAAEPKPDERFKADLLVVVAHPDDETEIGAYLARAIFDEHKRVAVVFGTRGNSGGNEQGQEQAAALGLEREIEARTALAHFDVSHVWFLNGYDTPGQDVLDSLETWDHGDSLGRLVRIVRLTRPEVIATWLPHWVSGENHGDHQAAGVLATEAFDLAGDPTAFAEELAAPRNRHDVSNLTEGLRPWQAQKLYFFSDAENTDFLKGRGPAYGAKEESPSRHESYARLAAEECAYHLTQGDSGQMAADALKKNDLHNFETPVLFVLGKSLVRTSKTGDLFEGVSEQALEYHAHPAYQPERETKPAMELGGPWYFYRRFWQVHELDNLRDLVGPEILAQPGKLLTIPLVIENPTSTELPVTLTIALPEGWEMVRHPEAEFTVAPHAEYGYTFAVKTSTSQKGVQPIDIRAVSNKAIVGTVSIATGVNSSAMPQ